MCCVHQYTNLVIDLSMLYKSHDKNIIPFSEVIRQRIMVIWKENNIKIKIILYGKVKTIKVPSGKL